MSTTQDRLLRLLAMVPYLQSNTGIAIEELAADFGVSTDQIRDDLLMLMMTGTGEFGGDLIDVDVTSLEKHGIINLRDAEFMSRPLRITAHEGAALVVALRTMRAASTDDHVAIIDGALSKIETALGAEINPPVDVVVDQVDPAIRQSVTSALAEGTKLQITYATDTRDEQTDRVVEPRRIFTERGRLYLEAWCLRADDLRFFRLDRVSAAKNTTERVAQHQVEPRAMPTSMFAVAPGTGFVRVDLHPDATWLADYYPVELTEQQPSGVWSAKVYGADPVWLARLLLRTAGNLRPIESEPIAQQVIDDANTALAAYDESTDRK